MSLFCMSFLFCVFRTTHLPQKAQTNSGYVGRSDRDLETLFEVLLGFVCFLKKNVLQKILLFFCQSKSLYWVTGRQTSDGTVQFWCLFRHESAAIHDVCVLYVTVCEIFSQT